MDYIPNCFSEKLSKLPGKTDKDQNTWLPLWIHLMDTAGVMKRLAEYWVPDQEKRAICKSFSIEQFVPLCEFLALVHDMGKMTPLMTMKLLYGDSGEIRDRLFQSGLEIPERAAFGRDVNCSPHPLAGEAILLKKGVPESLAVIVGAHHGKPQGLNSHSELQMELYPKNYYANCSESGKTSWENLWKEWLTYTLSETGYDSVSTLPNLEKSEEMLLTGLLIMADWIASNTLYFPLIPMSETGESINIQERVEEGWERVHLPDPWVYEDFSPGREEFYHDFGFYPNEMQETVLNTIEDTLSPGLIILEAPMGIGKTEAALAAAEVLDCRKECGGLYFGLPTQATANGIFPRLEAWAIKQSDETLHAIRLAHGQAELNDDYQALFHGSASVDEDFPEDGLMTHEWFKGRKQALLADFVIGTIDQLLMAALKQKHVMLRHVGLCGKVVILDEVHSYDAYMSQYLYRTLRWLGQYGTPVILLSATLPFSRRNEMVKAYLGINHIDELIKEPENIAYPLLTWTDGESVNQKSLPIGNRSCAIQIEKGDDSLVSDLLSSALQEGGCAGVILNTVKRAQQFFEQLREDFPDKEIILIHSGFVATDRAEKEKLILNRIGESSLPEERNNLIIVGTQVLEQSLDIDFDFMITDLCPMDLLLQRLGRLHRHDRQRPQRLQSATCVVLGTSDQLEPGSAKVYGSWLLLRTRSLLPDQILLPDMIAELVQNTYADPTTELLEDDNLKASWEAYDLEVKKKQRAADAFRLSEPEKPSKKIRKFLKTKTIKGLLDTDFTESGNTEGMRDARAQAMVRDTDPSMEVLVMVMDQDGQVRYLPWQNDGRSVATDRPPSEEEARCIARQRMRLPRVLCFPSVLDGTIDELEEINRRYLPEWQRSPMLRGELVLLLDEEMRAVIGNYCLLYSKENGIVYEQIRKGDEQDDAGI